MSRYVGGYEIRDQIDCGAQGRVSEAWNPRLGKRVALKELLNVNPTEEERRLFQRELRTQSSISDHPHVVPVLDGGECEITKTQYIVTPLLHGETLAKRFARISIDPLSLPAILQIATEAVSGILHIHIHELIHRDIKPSNIMLVALPCNPRCFVTRVFDFGVVYHACSIGGRRDPTAVRGTPSYMSPEQVQGECDLDYRSDIFSIGTVIYELLAKRNPFRGETIYKSMDNVVNKAAPRLTGVPAALADLVEAMLQKERDNRPKNAAIVLERLDTIRHELSAVG
jgi:serine/threonine-protein kinase